LDLVAKMLPMSWAKNRQNQLKFFEVIQDIISYIKFFRHRLSAAKQYFIQNGCNKPLVKATPS